MADIPSAKEFVNDRGLQLSGSVSAIPAVVGVCSLGADNSVKSFSSIRTLIAERGEGPGVEEAAAMIATIGQVVFVCAASTIAASFSAANMVPSAAGPDITFSGTALIDANVYVEITLAGARGTGKFIYSLDDFTGATSSDRTYSAEILIPSGGAYVIPGTGVTITFEAIELFVLGETYTGTINSAALNATDLAASMDALKLSGKQWRFVRVVTSNNNGDATAHAVLAAALQAKLTSFETAAMYRRGITCTNLTGANPTTAFASVVATRLLIAHGRIRGISAKPLIGYAVPTLSAGLCFAIRAAGSLPSTDLKRVPGNGINDGGALPNVVSIFEDEEKNPTDLDAIKVSTLRTYEGGPQGFFITQGRLKSADGSDFTHWARGILMDIACEKAHSITVTFIGRGLRANDDGTIDERDAGRLEDEVNAVLEAALKDPRNAEGTEGHVSDVAYRINRTINMIATETIEGEVAMRPNINASYVRTTLSFKLVVRAEEAA